MSLIVGRMDRCVVQCDNPLVNGCRNRTQDVFGQAEARKAAERLGWYHSESTGRWTCPSCQTASVSDAP